MKIEDIRGLLHAQPFRAFVLHTADGRALPVPHPDYVFITLGGRTLIVNSTTNDLYTIIDAMLIPRIEVSVEEAAAPEPEHTQPS